MGEPNDKAKKTPPSDPPRPGDRPKNRPRPQIVPDDASPEITPVLKDDQNDGWQPKDPDGDSSSSTGSAHGRQAQITPDPEDDQGDGCVSGPVTEPDKMRKLPRTSGKASEGPSRS